ncbi:MAG: glycosyltransferase family A protein [Anaerolineales bacterium]
MTRVSFGILALNAKPFLEYNLRALYPLAHEIIVVEGAVRAAASLATPDGHSTDGTVEMVAEFKKKHDPENKLSIVFAEDQGYTDGFWPEKDEMSRAYAQHLTGDWLWQVDSDEFYREQDLQAILRMIAENPSISAISFPYLEFFGSFQSLITGSWHLYEQTLCHRIFRWGPGYSYSNHRPPTVLDASGTDLRKKHWISAPKNKTEPIYLFHYSYVFPKQAQQKVGYYSNVEWTTSFRGNKRWFEESYQQLKRPMFLGEKGWPNLQWLDGYDGQHPEAIMTLRYDLDTGKIKESLRPTRDIEKLLNSPLYTLLRVVARVLLAVYWPIRTAWKAVRRGLIVGQHG